MHLSLWVIAFLAFVPTMMMVSMSLRPSLDIFVDFWGLPHKIYLSNFDLALRKLLMPAVNSVMVAGFGVLGILLVSVPAAYVFARKSFPGKSILYSFIIILLMVPGLLLLTPKYILAIQLGLRDSYFGLWAFYVSMGQVFAIFLLTSFFRSLPEDLFEAARLDGAGDWNCLIRVAVPLSRPILITIGIVQFLAMYNDLIWPMLIINNPEKETMMLALLQFNPSDPETTGRVDMGARAAGYVFAAVPVFIVFWFCMKAYISGIMEGAVKG
jgi:ABC-type glycerol-3-phosphate transport system permease component